MNGLHLNFLNFEKLHGLGNDYIILNDRDLMIPEEKKSALALKLCRHHFSVGADGLIYVCSSDIADIKMRIFNSDGSEAEMCGNGIRCFSKYIYENNIIKKDEIYIETLKGIMEAKLNIIDNQVKSVRIDMGPPILECKNISVISEINSDKCVNEKIIILDKIFYFTAVSIGNPHAVIFVENQLDDDNLNMYGSVIESHSRFPKKVNTEFVEIISNTEGRVRVFERGVGITKSCGTGACAVVVAGVQLGHFKQNFPIIIHNDGGDLVITYTGETVYLEGPIERVFYGNIKNLEI